MFFGVKNAVHTVYVQAMDGIVYTVGNTFYGGCLRY